MKDIGEKIKKLRLHYGLTQDVLASAANTTKQTIHKYETGIISNIPASKIKAIADKLGTTPAYLMGWEDEKKLSISSTLSEKQHLILEKYNQLNTIGQCKTEAYIDGLLENKEYLKINSADDITYSTQVAAFGGAAKKGELKKSDVQYLNEEMEEFDN